jgi:hypothetical protein
MDEEIPVHESRAVVVFDDQYEWGFHKHNWTTCNAQLREKLATLS